MKDILRKLFYAFFILTIIVSAEGRLYSQNSFIRIFQDTVYDFGNEVNVSIFEAKDKSIYRTSYYSSYKENGSSVPKITLIRLDSAGQFIWRKSYKIAQKDPNNAKVFCQDKAGNIYLFYHHNITLPFNQYFSKGYVWKLSPDGELIWAKGLENTESTVELLDGAQYDNDDMLLCGTSFVKYTNGITYDWNPFVMRINTEGEILFQREISYASTPPHSGKFQKIIRTQDHGFVLLGLKNSNNSYCATGVTKIGTYIAKLDSTGTLLWGNQYPCRAPVDIFENNDGTFTVLTQAYNGPPSTSKTFGLFNIDSKGSGKWAREYEFTDTKISAVTVSRMFYRGSSIDIAVNLPKSLMILNLSTDGLINYANTIENQSDPKLNAYDSYGSAMLIEGKGFVMPGSVEYKNPTLIKTNQMGEPPCFFDIVPNPAIENNIVALKLYENNNSKRITSYKFTDDDVIIQSGLDSLSNKLYCLTTAVREQALSQDESFVLYPNPAYQSVTISSRVQDSPAIDGVRLHDIYGNLFRCTSVRITRGVELDLTVIPPGLYIVSLQTSARTIFKKLVVQR